MTYLRQSSLPRDPFAPQRLGFKKVLQPIWCEKHPISDLQNSERSLMITQVGQK